MTTLLTHNYDLFVFDLDGTLIDSRVDIAGAANRTLAAFGEKELTEAKVIGFVGSGVHQLIGDLFFASGGKKIENPVLEEAFHYFMRDYGEHCTERTRFYPGAQESIVTLQRHEKKLAVLTNKPQALSEKILNFLGHSSTFDPVIGGDTSLGKKPSPRALLEIMRIHRTTPARMLMVGDSEIDIETARAAGCDSLVVLEGFGNAETLRAAKPTWILQDFIEFREAL